MTSDDRPLRKVREYRYTDPEFGTEHVCYDVMYRTPDDVRNVAAWGEYYLVARYGDREAAEYYVRTGHPPKGYG